MKTVSVIIPLKNTEEYVEQCVQSVIEQTYSQIEIIIVDDHSTDNSYEIVDSLANQYNHIKLLKLTGKTGVGAARNYGMEQATGDYIYFLNSDDILPEQTIELLVEHIGSHDMIRGRMNTNHLINSFVFVYHSNFNPRMYTDNKYNLIRNNRAINFLIKKDYIGKHKLKFSEDASIYSDLYFIIPALSHTHVIPYLNEAIYLRRRRDNPTMYSSLSQQPLNVLLKEYVVAYCDLKNQYKEDPLIIDFLDNQLLNYYRKEITVEIYNDNAYESLFSYLYEAMTKIDDEKLKTFPKSFRRELNAIRSGNQSKYKRINGQHNFLRDALKGMKSKAAFSRFVYQHVFSRLPQKKKMILFESFGGKGYSDSPKYIYEYMLKNYPNYKFIWSVNEPLEIPGSAKQVNRMSLTYYYYLARAKYWVLNARMPNNIYKPDGKVYVQTWHGTPLKKLAGDMDNVLMPGTNPVTYKRNFSNETAKWDYLVSPNAYSSEIFKRAFWFNNEMLDIGYPRNDILYNWNNEEKINELKMKMNLPLDKKVVLYAPTWRDDEYYEVGSYKFDLKLELDKLQSKLGDDHIVILRMHYLIATNMDISGYEQFVYDFSSYNDISELYLVSDVLITDYSSVFFDYANLRRPILFYTYDIEKYASQLRGFYLDMKTEVPGPLLTTTEEVIDSLENIDLLTKQYSERYDTFYNRFCEWDDGRASQRLVERILKD